MSTNLDTSVPRFNVHTTDYEPSPEWGGHKKFLYESPDGARIAGSFKESGHYDYVMPRDEFFYVIAGSSKVAVQGGETFELVAGDCVFLRKGLSVTFDHSPDFHDVAVLMAYDDNDKA
ncbi:cupin domain-containing protein [Paenarthrobacter nicotinovorans]|uniref:cupin domain-containing protein n=1 Tax=Paenarthrobacter nicotinovorans TaxID=29320 RepID=UPI003D66DB5E